MISGNQWQTHLTRKVRLHHLAFLLFLQVDALIQGGIAGLDLPNSYHRSYTNMSRPGSAENMLFPSETKVSSVSLSSRSSLSSISPPSSPIMGGHLEDDGKAALIADRIASLEQGKSTYDHVKFGYMQNLDAVNSQLVERGHLPLDEQQFSQHLAQWHISSEDPTPTNTLSSRQSGRHPDGGREDVTSLLKEGQLSSFYHKELNLMWH